MEKFTDLCKKWSAEPKKKVEKEMKNIIESVKMDTEAMLDAFKGLEDNGSGPDEDDYILLFYGFWTNAAPAEFVKSFEKAADARHPLALKFQNLLFDAAIKFKITREKTLF